MPSFCKNKALACHMDFSRTGRSALHSSGGHSCSFLRVTECNDEPPSTGTAPGTPIAVGMAEQLSPDGKQRMLMFYAVGILSLQLLQRDLLSHKGTVQHSS